jgi:hypothetical protein
MAERRATLSRGKATRSTRCRCNEDMEDKLDKVEVAITKAEPTTEGHTKEALEKIKDAVAEGRQPYHPQTETAQTG